MARVYLETSFVSACVTTRSSLRSAYEREVSLLWWAQEGSRHELFVSDEVLQELGNRDYPRSNEALNFIRDVPVLPTTDEMISFAEVLVERMVMPKPIGGDALHVAIAVIGNMDYVLTWNVRHLANPNKVLHLNAVCVEHGHISPRIVRPDDLKELER